MTDNSGQKVSFRGLVERHGRIQVPLIQRDYAQGRADQVEVREEFLAALLGALKRAGDHGSSLNLDFIYGTAEGGEGSHFSPLDGQQRLTTLFLLHWYLAWQDGQSMHFQEHFGAAGRSRFTYKVRPSSSEFFDQLINFWPQVQPCDVLSLSAYITDQAWYFRSWRLDPTIQSSLTMLDHIHTLFQAEQGLYERLVCVEAPAITFQLLDLEDFGLSDDLYIKMNARGKPLTVFETFKARFEQHIERAFSHISCDFVGSNLTVPQLVARQMDTRWADFFWPYRDKSSHLFDDAVMRFFRFVLIITRDPASESYSEDINDLRSRHNHSGFAFFSQRGWLDEQFVKTFVLLLETWGEEVAGFSTVLPDNRWFSEKAFFEKLVRDPLTISYEEIVLVYGFCQFCAKHGTAGNKESFLDWMRVVFNLSVNSEYNRPSDLQRSIESLKHLEDSMATILDYLCSPDAQVPGFNRQQVAEERIKGRLIRAQASWTSLILDAEKHPYFIGQVGFLLRFSSVFDADESVPIEQWDADEHTRLQRLFSNYFDIASVMFGRSGLRALPGYLWERALLSQGDYLLSASRNHSLLINTSTDQASWKRLLRLAGEGLDKSRTLQSLWDQLDVKGDIVQQLHSVIESSTPASDWQAELIATPSAIQYCESRMIRHVGVKTYLMKRKQMNGEHAELLTYALYKRVYSASDIQHGLVALAPVYHWSYSTDDEPGLLFRGAFKESLFSLFIENRGQQFHLSVAKQSAKEIGLDSVLLEFGFSEEVDQLALRGDWEEVEQKVGALDQYLAAQGAS